MVSSSRRTRLRAMGPAVLALTMAIGCGGQAEEATGSTAAAARAENPFAGVKGYVDPEWKAHALAEPGGDRVADSPTAIWIRGVGWISGVTTGTSLRQHFDNALAQGAGYIEVVLQDRPGGDCAGLPSNDEFQRGQVSRYQTEFIDPIAAIEADSKYASLRIINVIEPGALSSLIANLSSSRCTDAQTSTDYVGAIQYALGKLGAIPNAYNYLDIAHHGVLGWESSLSAAVALYAKTIQGASGGFGTVAGFVSNVGNYSATVEPFFQVSAVVGGVKVRQSKWVDWATYVDEQSLANAWKTAMVGRGMSDKIGMIIDTSRNGWGGSSRPTKASTSTDVDTFVNESRIDRRASIDNWCNQSGAGLGERPRAVDANGIQAYVWIKRPGESDGASPAVEIPDDEYKGLDGSCDPFYLTNGTTPTGALPGAPVSERWFSAEFRELMANAYPPLDAVPASDTTPPSAPGGLVSTDATTSTVTLSWTASTDDVGVANYLVYAGSTMVAGSRGTTATVLGLQSNTTYTFTVRATDAAGNLSAASSGISLTTACACDTTPPSAPAELTYSDLSYDSVTLHWTASTDDVGVVGYEVRESNVVIGTTTTTQFEVTDRLPGSTHYFTVRAVDAAGNQSKAGVVLVKMLSFNVPWSPSNLRWTASGGTVELCWDAPPVVAEGDGYYLLYGSFNLGWFAETCVTLIGFKPGTPYTFSVKTVSADGSYSSPTNTVTVLLDIPPDTTPPTAPTGLAGYATSLSSVWLTWTASKDDTGVVLYQIYADGSLVRTVAASTAATISGLASYRSYTFTVKAVDAAGNVSAASNAVTVWVNPGDGDPPGPPTNLHVTGVTDNSVSLAWTAGTDEVGVVLYQVFTGGVMVATTSSTSVTVPNLTTGTAYTFTVKSVDASGKTSVASDPVGAMPGVGPIDPQVPAAPTDVRAAYRAANAGDLMLSWTASTAGVPAVAYKVYEEGIGLIRTTTLTTMPITGYGAGSTHTFTVRAVDAAGDLSPASAAATITIARQSDTVSPMGPTNLMMTATTASSVTLAWTAATDDQRMGGYDLYADGILVGISRATTATISNLAARAYTIDVRARDAAGNVSVGAETIVTPGALVEPGGDPTAPGNLRIAESRMGTGVVLSWDPPVSGGTVTGYEVHEQYPSRDYLVARTAITSAILTSAGGGVGSFYVKALRGSASASTSALLSVIFPDTGGDPVLLASISQLKATATGTAVALTWSPISSPCDLWYKIYANDVLVGITTSASGSVANLAAGSSYAFTVSAVDSCADASPISDPVTVSIPK